VNVLTQPAVVALLASALAAGVHPRLRFGLLATETGTIAVAAVALLLTLAYAARARRGGLAERVAALGALAVVAGLAFDGARAHRGVMTIGLGHAKAVFEEEGPDGRALGLRPLGFQVQVVRASGSQATLALPQGGEVTVTASRAVRVGSFRLGDPRLHPSGAASSLTVNVTDASGTQAVQLSEGLPARLGDLELELERYFPDFALDERQQPFSRSAHSRNPAALLRVRRGDKTSRVFVIRSMPGLHEVAELGKSFALSAVEPEISVHLRVAQEPFAPTLAAGALALLVAVGLGRRPA
jgi:hypothetical protein